MNVDETSTDASNQNPGEGSESSQGGSNAPQGGAADAPKPSEGQGDTPADATKPEDAKDDSKDGEKPDDDKAKDDKPEGAPEQYESFTLPEGWALEGERLDSFVQLAKRAGLTQAEAQAEVDRFTAGAGEALGAQASKLIADWGQQLKEDPEFGGAGLEANLQTAGKAVAEFGGEQLAKDLDTYGLGNLPSLNKAFLKAAHRITELETKLKDATGEPSDMPGSGTQHSGGGSIAERMYPGMAKT